MDPAAPELAVTGATGRLGKRVARRLEAAGVPQRLIVRDAARAPAVDNCDVRVATYGDAAAVRSALDGIKTVFMVSGAEDPHRVAQHLAFVDAAVGAGVSRVVYTSFYGAAPTATFTLARDHWATEQHIRTSGMAFTFLRDNLYLDFFPQLMGDDAVIRGPAGDGRVAAVAQDDIADVAATVLLEAGRHDGLTYELTGPESLTLAEVAERLSRLTGRPIRYHAESLDEAYASRARYGAPDWQVDAWVSTYTAIASGELAEVTDAVERVAGHPPTGLDELFHRAAL